MIAKARIALVASTAQQIRSRKARQQRRRTLISFSDVLAFFFLRNFAPPFSVEQVGMEALACFPTNENLFALLPIVRSVFESQMANDTAALQIDDSHRRL